MCRWLSLAERSGTLQLTAASGSRRDKSDGAMLRRGGRDCVEGGRGEEGEIVWEEDKKKERLKTRGRSSVVNYTHTCLYKNIFLSDVYRTCMVQHSHGLVQPWSSTAMV